MSYVVALTGGIGSGKSTVAESFARHGVSIVDADVIARQVVEPGQPALHDLAVRLGQQILLPDGSLNRALLREIIFSDPTAKQWVNQLLHPLIHAKTRQFIAAATTPYVLWVVPLLIENGLQKQAIRSACWRSMLRDGVDRQQAERILCAQVSHQQRLACADDIIDNNGGAETIEPRVASLHSRYLELAASATRQDIDKNE